MPGRLFKCFYCDTTVNFNDLIWVDDKFNQLESEEHEYILDYLHLSINSERSRANPYVHESDLGYDVLNICRNCFGKASRSI